MLSNFLRSLHFVLQSEGGFVDNPLDAGGATMKGITLKVFQEYKRNNHLNSEDLRNISDEDIQAIYRQNYWNPVFGNLLNSGCDYLLFDFAVNAGVGRSIKTLQKVVGTNVDGVMGNHTLDVANALDPSTLIIDFSNAKIKFYEDIVMARPNQNVFLKGWLNRVATVKSNAFQILGA